MGTRMVRKLIEDGHTVFVWNRSSEPVENLITSIEGHEELFARITPTQTIHELITALESPRIIWSMLPSGEVTEYALSELGKYVQKGDIIIDGGNAHFADTQKRFEFFKKRSVRFLGIGISGGVLGKEQGFAMMAGGDKIAFEIIMPLLETLSHPHADFTYLGEGGVGHFAKMVHNAIEYGMMQSIGEGFGILEKSPYAINLLQVAKVFQKGTIISSFLMDRTVDSLAKDEHLEHIAGVIAESGEAKWAIGAAKKEKVPYEVIGKSLEFRKKSQKNKKIQISFAAKLVAALRREFGGHSIEKIST